jgi:hypothetical protein
VLIYLIAASVIGLGAGLTLRLPIAMLLPILACALAATFEPAEVDIGLPWWFGTIGGTIVGLAGVPSAYLGWLIRRRKRR